jgi:uncharacterized protein
MDKKLKVVLDTNILVSASFRKTSPIPLRIYQALQSQKFILVTSLEIMQEVKNVINRDYIIARSQTTNEDRIVYIETLLKISIITPNTALLQNISRDRKDDKFLACAIEGNADYIVSGDRDLLVLMEYKGIKIVTPNEFGKAEGL